MVGKINDRGDVVTLQAVNDGTYEVVRHRDGGKQRLATTGGLAPAPDECNAATLGQVAEIPYTADYAFWKATGN